MKIRILYTTLLLALAPLNFATEAQAPAPVATEVTNEPPFFRTSLYPAWSQMTPQQALIDVRAAIKQAHGRLEKLAAVTPETATFDNTFLAWYEAAENIKQTMNYVYHLQICLGDKDMQNMMDTLLQETTNYTAEGLHAPRIVEVLLAASTAPWVQELSPAKQRFVQQTLNNMHKCGLMLPQEQQVRKAQIEQELSRLSFRFSQYVKMSPMMWELVITNPDELAGMPERWMQNAYAHAQQSGYATAEKPAWLINLSTSPASAVLKYCTVSETRRKCWQGTTSPGTKKTLDTEPLIHRILELRHELATIMGYKNFADKEAALRMMGSGEKALAFVDDLLSKSKPAWDAYVADEIKRYSQACGQELTAVAPWDTAFLNRHLPPKRSAFNVNEVTPYLQAEKVIPGLMNIWAKMLSLNFEPIPTVCLKPGEKCPDGHVEVWYPGVSCYAVKDATSGAHLGSFYLDLYTRPGKRAQAWCMPLRDGNPAPDGSLGEPHLAALMANLTPAVPGQPHLFNHGDVYMLYHEFGHLMHMMLGHGEIRPHCTAEVERDFVEMPSHLQENWIWEPEALATFAFHYKTGEPIPAELAQRLAASRGSNPIEMHMRMLLCSKLDLELHMHWHDKYKGRPIDEVAEEILRPWLFPYTEQAPTEQRTMTYTMSEGYAACLYTYKWCEVMAADAMNQFRTEGILNPEVGMRYRRAILEKGSSIPAMQQIRDFLGREPQPDALLKLYQKK